MKRYLRELAIMALCIVLIGGILAYAQEAPATTLQTYKDTITNQAVEITRLSEWVQSLQSRVAQLEAENKALKAKQ